VVLFSPWLDISMSNPAAAQVEEQDPILGIAALRQCDVWWAGGDDARNPLLSPVFADLSGLPPMDVFHGTADVLIADACLLREKVKQAGGEIHLYEYPGAFHDFVGVPFLPESQHALARVAEVLGSEAGR
jgi:acetyl esterase/lipase